MNLNEVPKVLQAACLYIGRPVLESMGIKYEMSDVYKKLQVEHVTTLQQVRIVAQALFNKNNSESDKKNIELEKKLNKKTFYCAVLEYQNTHPNSWVKSERHQMTEGFKELLLSKKEEYGLTWQEVSELLSIPEDTLKKIKRQSSEKNNSNDDDTKGPPLADHIIDKLGDFFKSRSQKATVKDFCEKNPDILIELKMDYRQFSSLLLRLGYVSVKGIFLQNTGLDLIKRFSPNIIWGTDGKNINIVINGESFRWVWQCLIDYKTTILVGGVINENESTLNLVEAIGKSKESTGVAPMAIVMDNRLSENLPAIQEYLNKLEIEIIKTFPGNSKSNGIIENNFRVFEAWVHGRGEKIIINGENPKELSRSIAELMVEVFTQMRNHSPRKSLRGRSATEVSENIPQLSDKERSNIQDEIKALANRLKNELATPIKTAAKEEALKLILEKLNPPNPEVFLKRLTPCYYTGNLILQAYAIFEIQKQKHPEKNFDHTYFGGILRNLVDQEYIVQLNINLELIFNEYWERINQKIKENNFSSESPEKQCVSLVNEYLTAKIPAQCTLVLSYIKNIFYYVVATGVEKVSTLRKALYEKIKKEKLIITEKRELLIRKIYEFESSTKLMFINTENYCKNSTQVIPNSFDPLFAT